jgi:peroxiredoxin
MPAPDFTLTDQNGDDWTLSDHLDAAVVLLFLRGDW